MKKTSPIYFGAMESPIGTVYAAVDGGAVISLSFTSSSEADFFKDLSALTSRPISMSDAVMRPLIRELREYFDGRRKEFTFSPSISGFTPFQERVLREAMRIPYGKTSTYGRLAARAGNPRAARAVGQVMAHNRVPIIIPCHRVLGSDGRLCGFAGGLRAFDIKEKLLAIENIRI